MHRTIKELENKCQDAEREVSLLARLGQVDETNEPTVCFRH